MAYDPIKKANSFILIKGYNITRPTIVATSPASGRVIKNGRPRFFVIKAPVYAPMPINGTCAREKSPVVVMRRKLTARIRLMKNTIERSI
jgi:hypothetical protein